MVAETGDVHAGGLAGLEDGEALGDIHREPIDKDLHDIVGAGEVEPGPSDGGRRLGGLGRRVGRLGRGGAGIGGCGGDPAEEEAAGGEPRKRGRRRRPEKSEAHRSGIVPFSVWRGGGGAVGVFCFFRGRAVALLLR